MKIKRVGITILVLLFSFVCFIGLSGYYEKPVLAQSSCPENMEQSSEQCFQYLQDQLKKLQREEGNIEKQLEQEEYQQLSLSEKIAYTNNQIAQTETAIKSLEIEIASHNVEISLLEKSIQEKEDNVSVLGQEISILEGAVNRRITESYKSSFIGPLELFLDLTNFSSVLRKTKYLATTRSQDRKHLKDYNDKRATIKEEEHALAEKKAELQNKRNSIEKEKTELAGEREVLSVQKVERERLLALSRAKEAELLAELKRNKEIQSQLDEKILAYINANMGNMTEEGYVAKGGKIGYIYPGGNACSGSTGPHLHFAASTSSSSYFYANVDLYRTGHLVMGAPSGREPAPDGWDWKFALPGKFVVPLAGSGVYITQDYHDPNLNYIQDPDETQYYATDLSMIGGSANATVVAAEAGYVKRGTDYCGQDYVIIYHPDLENTQYRTIYVHLTFDLQ
jgi:peptidoglycan hydrolase CwlO-like protein